MRCQACSTRTLEYATRNRPICGFLTRSRDSASHEVSWSLDNLSNAVSNCRVQRALDVVTQIHLTIEFVQDFPGFFVCSAPAKLQLRVHLEYFYSNVKDDDVDEQRSRTPAGNALRSYQPSRLLSLHS